MGRHQVVTVMDEYRAARAKAERRQRRQQIPRAMKLAVGIWLVIGGLMLAQLAEWALR